MKIDIMKRIILMIIFIGMIPISCEYADPYFKINNMICEVYKDDSLTQIFEADDKISNSFTYFKINVTYEYLSKNSLIRIVDFATPLMANRCGYNGLKDKLKSIKIYTNNVFNENPAGSDIKALFKWHDVQWDSTLKSIDSLVYELNNNPIFIGWPNKYFFKIILENKPTDGLDQVYNFDFLYESGDHQLVSSSEIHYNK